MANAQFKKNDLIDLTIEGCSVDGNGVGHCNGMVVFVPETAVGDEISARLLKVKKNYAFAKIESIKNPSPDRIKPLCPVYHKCGGCVFSHMDYSAEVALKAQHVEQCFKRIGGVFPDFEPVIAAENIDRYRNKAQFPVACENGKIKFGFFSRRSHRVVPCTDCLLQPSEFSEILEIISSHIEKYRIPIYDEILHSGVFRHTYIRKGTESGEIMVCAVINADGFAAEDELAESIFSAVPAVKSFIVNVNKENTNVVLGKTCRTVKGKDHITDTLCNLRFRISPLSFYQVNRDQAEKLYYKAAEYASLTGDEILLDLYCGTGTIGLSMASKVKELIGVEIVPQAIKDAKLNAAENNIENARFICADAAQAAETLLSEGVRPDVIVIDPPRKGCSPDMITTAARMSPQRIVYVSCDPATLARDCAAFDSFGYSAVKATPVDMFPRTGHVETVVLLSQRRPDTHIDIKLDLSELDVTAAETKATYQEIKDYVLEKFGLKVSSLYISQVKTKCGIIERENYNKPKSENTKQPKCPKEKEDAIMDALRHFRML